MALYVCCGGGEPIATETHHQYWVLLGYEDSQNQGGKLL